jgi:hypothetical protein
MQKLEIKTEIRVKQIDSYSMVKCASQGNGWVSG